MTTKTILLTDCTTTITIPFQHPQPPPPTHTHTPHTLPPPPSSSDEEELAALESVLPTQFGDDSSDEDFDPHDPQMRRRGKTTNWTGRRGEDDRSEEEAEGEIREMIVTGEIGEDEWRGGGGSNKAGSFEGFFFYVF